MIEISNLAHDIIRVATPQCSGRPRFVTAAIRRSAIVAAMGIRSLQLSRFAPIAALLGSVALFGALSRELLETRGLLEENFNHWAWIALQAGCALYLVAVLKGARTTMALRRVLAF